MRCRIEETADADGRIDDQPGQIPGELLGATLEEIVDDGCRIREIAREICYPGPNGTRGYLDVTAGHWPHDRVIERGVELEHRPVEALEVIARISLAAGRKGGATCTAKDKDECRRQ